MDTKSRIVGSHARFYREGDAITVPAPGIASATVKPGTTDPLWIDFSLINNLEIMPTVEEKEVFAPNPGHLELDDVITTKRKLTIKFDAEKLSDFSYEMAFRTAPLSTPNVDTNYDPDSGPQMKGWLQFDQYDQNDVIVNSSILFGYLKVTGSLKADENIIKTAFEFLKMRSTLNAGTVFATV